MSVINWSKYRSMNYIVHWLIFIWFWDHKKGNFKTGNSKFRFSLILFFSSCINALVVWRLKQCTAMTSIINLNAFSLYVQNLFIFVLFELFFAGLSKNMLSIFYLWSKTEVDNSFSFRASSKANYVHAGPYLKINK